MAVDAADPSSSTVAAPGSDAVGTRASSRRGDRRGLARSADNSQADDTPPAAAEIVAEGPDHLDDDDFPYELVSLSQAQPY